MNILPNYVMSSPDVREAQSECSLWKTE